MPMWNKKIKRQELDLRSPRKRKNFFEKREDCPRNPAFSRFIFKILFLLFLGSIFYILFFSPFLKSDNVYLKGVEELNYNDVYQKISDSLEIKYFCLISKNNLILFPEKEIKTSLLKSFKKISEIKVIRIFPNSIVVEVKERKSLLLWCSAGPCYIVDEKGYAYTGADFESEEIKQNNLLNIVDNSARPVAIGEKILNEDYIDFVLALGDELNREIGIKIANEYQTQSRVSEELRVKTEEGWDIYFSSAIPLEESIRTLATFLEKEMPEDKRNNLEYVDLRAENKVYYKFKDKEETQDGTDLTQEEEKKTQTDAEKKDDKKKKN